MKLNLVLLFLLLFSIYLSSNYLVLSDVGKENNEIYDLIKKIEEEYKNEKFDNEELEKQRVIDVKQRILSTIFERNKNKHELADRNREFINSEKQKYFGRNNNQIHPQKSEHIPTRLQSPQRTISLTTHFTLVHTNAPREREVDKVNNVNWGFPVDHLNENQKQQLESLKRSHVKHEKKMQEQYHQYPSNDIHHRK